MLSTYDKIPQELLEENLITVAKVLPPDTWFIFFGSLLGMVRESRLIEGDDDIDIYVDREDTAKVTDALKRAGFRVSMDFRPFFMQFFAPVSGRDVPIDFYFFEKNESVLTESWNFFGDPDDPEKTLKIPREMIYPIRKIWFCDVEIPVPARAEEACRFLYGNEWRYPMKKSIGYRMNVINGTPYMRKPTLREFLSAWNKIHLRARIRDFRKLFLRKL